MFILALCWFFMISFYLLATRCRRWAEKFGFLGWLTNLAVYLLVFIMGLRMGANHEVTSSLGTIGVQAVLVTALTMGFGILGAFLGRKLLHVDRRALTAAEAAQAQEAAAETSDEEHASGSQISLMIFLMVALGTLCGYFIIPRICTDLERFQAMSGDWLIYGLCILLALIGFGMGLDGKAVAMLRGAGFGVMLVPIFTVVFTLLAGVVYAAISPMSLREALAISVGFGWYTMAPSVISGAGYAVAGAISFLHNVLRETLGFILLPIVAEKIGYIEATTMPGTAAMDMCMPLVERSCNPRTMAYSFCMGMLMCITCAALVPLLIGV